MNRARRILVGLAALGLLAWVPAAIGAGSQERGQSVDLQVALRAAGKCGTWAESLPALVIRSGLQPGDRMPDVEVCLRNRGNATGIAWLRVIERGETETACTADEPTVDPTCAIGMAGELGDGLGVIVALRAGCAGQASPIVRLPFGFLHQYPVPVAELRKNEVSCVILGLEYRVSTAQAAAASQTDRVTWRYAFDLVD